MFATDPVTGQRMVIGADQLRLRVALAMTENNARRDVKMGIKSTYIDSLVAEEVPYPDAIIVAMKLFKREHRIGREPAPARLAGMQTATNVIMTAYNAEPIELRMQNIDGGESAHSFYQQQGRYVLLTGKLSVVTWLHELGHALGYDEEQARKWSICLFKKIYPISFERLEMGDPNDPTSFYMVMPRAQAVVPVGQASQLDAAPVIPTAIVPTDEEIAEAEANQG